jgi:hypothetical protein
MRYKAIFGIGFGAGYVLGAKAGRQRYDTFVGAARGFAEHPAVQETAGVLQAQAGDLLDTAKRTAGRATSAAVDNAASTVAAKVKGTVGSRSQPASAPVPVPPDVPGSTNGTYPTG